MSAPLAQASAIEQKRQRLAKLLEERLARPQRYPLSFTQQRLWFLDQLDPGGTAYLITRALHLRGSLSPAAFEASLREIVRRHKVLRTRFTLHEGEPVQVVDRQVELALPTADLSDLPDGPRQNELQRLVQGNLRTPFDLRHGHLFRGTLLRLGTREHVVLLAAHHIVADGWSTAVIVKELAALYTAFCTGFPSPLPRLPLQYAEYADWQRRWLTGDVLEAQLGYWKQRLSDAAPLELPIDHPRPPTQTFRGADVPAAVSPELREALAGLGRRRRATLFMTVLAVLQTLLSRVSGVEDVSVGSPIANRGRQDLELLIGFFANTLVLRTDLSGDPTFEELLERVREVALGAFAHQDMPLEKLVQEIQPERDLARSPLFQVLFVGVQPATDAVLELPGLTLEIIEADRETAKFDLTLELAESSAGLQGALEYNADLFERSTAARLLGHFGRLLEAVVAAPEQRIGDLPLLSEGERAQILIEWNATAETPNAPDSLVQLFEAQAAKTPERTAVVSGGESLTYAELSARARQLARHLQRLGVGLDVPVGVYLDRSLELVVAVLGVLKAGGGYLPLDPAYPPERLAFMLEDSGVGVVLTQERLAESLPSGAFRVLRLDSERPAFDGYGAEPLSHPAGLSGRLAYLIYTSGSTGRPKGVAMPHRALVSLMAYQIRRSEEALRTLQFSALSFDVSCQELFSTWGAGGTLFLISEELRRDVGALLDFIAEHGIERLFLPFVALRQLAETAEERGTRTPSLREVITAGEALQTTSAVARWLARTGVRRLDNQYGPSETHVATAHALEGEPRSWPLLPPIGRPVANAQAYVCDRRSQPLPIGVAGELYLGGTCVARGYAGQPAVTAERFVPDPFGGTPGGRLYRTGDLARWQAGGVLEFLGRVDHQVKVRGFRVELGEIETTLAKHPGVRQAVVAVRDDLPGGRRLVAFVVSAGGGDGSAPTAAEIRQLLRERLPDYMVPGHFAFLDRLPVTPSGKVDRRALSQLQVFTNSAAQAAEPAVGRSPAEELMAGIFAELLQAERVAPDQSFFDIGGHSLLATRLVSRLRQVFGVELPVRTVFEAPTAEGLAAAVEQALRRGEETRLPPLVRVARDGPLPLSFAQQRLWFLDQLQPASSAYSIPLAVRLVGHLDPAALAAALSEIVRRHEALRTTFEQGPAGEPVQKIQPSALVYLPIMDLRGLASPGAELMRLAWQEASRPFHLAAGPVLRASLVLSEDREQVLLLTVHHIVSDGWSMGVLIRELGTLYSAVTHREASPLPELPVQYADFAVWQRRWLSGEVLASELAHWREHLAGTPEVLELPTDHPRPAVQTFRGATLSHTFPAILRENLQGLARRWGATLFMTLLAGFQTLLARLSGQTGISVGTPIAGRTHAQTEGLIGFFVNTLVMRSDLSDEPAFGSLLERVRETALEAYAHDDLPFEKLVEGLAPERDLSRPPLFQVMLALQNAPLEGLELPGLRLEPLPVDSGTAKFELTLSLAEDRGALLGFAEYNRDLFDATTILRLLTQLENLLRSALASPESNVFDLELMGAAERLQVVQEWSGTDSSDPRESCVHELFQERAKLHPQLLAVSFREEAWSYGELDHRSDLVAECLRSLGVGLEMPVGLFTERSLEMLAGVLGILKSGGVYVPLDPSSPAERLDWMLRDTGALVVLAQERLLGDLPEGPWQTVELVELCYGSGGTAAPARNAGSSPDNLAYILYTSGSTGKPKGVAVPHRAVIRLVRGRGDLCLEADEVWLQLAPLAFDASTLEIWGALANGGRLELFDPHKPTIEEIGQKVESAGVTSLWLTAGLFHQVAESDLRPLRGLRKLLAGGDVLSPAHVRRALEELPGCRVINGYGPTENTTFTCCHTLTAPSQVEGSVPIGRPIAHTRVYVVDRRNHPVPPGVAGELLTGGDGLARGYHGRPDLTAELFVPDPFAEQPGERLYRTGDLARWRPDGEIEFLGRIDQQVKIRGFRVEPGEIEAALGEHPSVQEAAVIVTGSGEARRLVAYCSCQEGAAELRHFLLQRLPEHLVPSAFVILPEMPLTANGKVDRKALAALRPELIVATAGAEPRTPAEDLLAGIFAEALQIERIGVHESFFDQGGHSLLATRVISRIRLAFGVELPLRDLFEAPTVAELTERIQQATRSAEGRSLPPIEPVSREGGLPLSFAQERLWFLEQLEPGGSAYNLPITLRIRGPLDIAAMKAAFNEITRRHKALRTTFASMEGRPVQVIVGPAPVHLSLVDLTDLQLSRRWPQALRWVRVESRRAFDLVQGPMLRCLLVRLEDREHLLLLNMHHIVSDGWSMGVLVRELTALYDAFVQGRPSPLAELPIQYADFASWQRQWLQEESLEAELSYWRKRLSGAPTFLELPTDRPRPAVQTFAGASFAFSLRRDLSARLQALSRHLGATLFMALLSAFQEILGRYSGQADLTIGTPVAGRTHLQTEELIGFFVNMLVVRTDLSGEPSFAALVRRVREALLSAYAHQDLPFEMLVEELQPERSLSHTPLFQVVLALQNTPVQALEMEGLSFETVPLETGTAKFDLTVSVRDTGDGLSGMAEYNTDLFDRATVERLVRHWQVLLAGVISAPERPLPDLEWVTPEERAQLLREWNDTSRPCPPRPMAHELFARQAALRPEATAVESSEGRLSYSEVERRANRLAWHLRGLGIGPDVPVAICTGRTLLRVVGIMAVLKAGGAYVSLDPSYPEKRLAFLLKDSRAPVLLTEARFAGGLPDSGAQVLCLDADWGSIRGEECTVPRSGVEPEHLAYVIYTSGSTGLPKGVEIPHAGLSNLVEWHRNLYQVCPEDRATQIASPAFDASVWELWPYLAAGASVHIPEEEARLSPPATIRWLSEQGITLAFLMTPLAERVLEETILADPGLRLRALITGGDRLHRGPDPKARFRLMNHYGPAEHTVVSTVTEVPPQGRRTGLPAIGRPIDNTRIYILNSGLCPVPAGVPGELCVAGAGLARGYHARPDLTAEKFVPDPFSGEPGSRMYRTADRVRWLPDGEIDFLGRLDHQVKIRGVRVELGEIETVLGRHAGLRDVAVSVLEDRLGDRRLVAYVVASGERCPEAGELRSFLAERLPEPMVPAAFVALDALPLTPNGKVDRRALPSPDWSAAVSSAAPSTQLEEVLAGIFAHVLGLERVGIEDDFFALGGHSLMATRLVSRLREAFGCELPLRLVFESPTVAKLAARIATLREGPPSPPIRPVPRDRELPLSFAQQRLWLVDQIEQGSPAYNIPMALRLSGRIEPALLERIFSEIVRRHEALRTTFASREEQPVQVINPPHRIELPLLDFSHMPETEREILARDRAFSEARRPFDLQRGPLLRLLLMRLAERDHLLLLTVHHIVSDGWSMGVLLREIAALHDAFSQGRPSPLPELPVQYADFAVWQRSWLQGEVLEAQLLHWKRQLAGAPAILELPLDRPRRADQSYRGARRSVDLSLPLAEAIGRLCRQQGLTPFMALFAAWTVLLGRHSGQDDVLVGAPIAGRNRCEIEGLIGFFLNTLVLRSDLSGNPSLAELLGRVRRTALDAFTNQDLPFERLVEDLAPERSLAHTPLFQVMFILQNTPGGDLAIPGLALAPIDVDTGLTKFDLSLTLSESPQGFAGALTYAADLIDPSTAERLISGFHTLLAGMSAAHPNEPLHALDVLSKAERQQLLVDWSTEETRTSDLSLYELFERQAERTPDATAVIFEDERWTYRDLLRRSRQIAGFLRRQGVGPEDRVAILDRRSGERVARVLGVLASGAAYVAVDREQPWARRAEILADVAPVRIFPPQPPLSPEEGEEGEMGAGVVLLPEVAPADSSGQSCNGFEPCPGPAYVVYTSGSTGRPKGILAHHRGAATYLEWVIRNYGLSESDVALQLAPLTFDASLRDTFAPLAAGGRIVIVPEDVTRNPAALLGRMEAYGVTCLPSIVPSLLRLLVEEALASGRKVPSLRLILASGEKLHGTDAAAVRQAFGGRVALINQYGASEATMASTWYPVTADDEALPALPVGRPAASARMFLLDRMLRPVPLGAVGEICFGGPGVTFGYLGQPDRTAEVFVPDPFGAPGGRLYRTGDRGRYRPDGILELLGRMDFQVKIRGQRVEPGEVEAVLRSHPAVRQAVVAARGEDEPRLVAWLVAEGAKADDLRVFLAGRLPAPMVPADWIFLDALPLSPHGKVDRSRLPEPSRERTAVQDPRDRTELRLVHLWEEVLGIQPIGICDNFFSLGGHSLSAVRLMSGVRRLFGRDLPLSELFRRPTIELLAETLRCSDRDLPWSPLVALTPGRSGEVPLFCIHGGDGHALTFADLARSLRTAGEEQPVLALEALGLSAGQEPLDRIEDLAELYLTAVREAWPRGPYRLLGYSMGGKIAFEMARRLEQDGEILGQLILLDIPAFPRTDVNLDLEIPEEVRTLPGFDPELAGRYLAVWRANLKASHSWTPAPFGGKVRLIIAEGGSRAGAADPTLGWGAVAQGGVEVVLTPGDHFSLLQPPNVQTLARRLRDGAAEPHLRRNSEDGSAFVAL